LDVRIFSIFQAGILSFYFTYGFDGVIKTSGPTATTTATATTAATTDVVDVVHCFRIQRGHGRQNNVDQF
jgi:hypothetical protein